MRDPRGVVTLDVQHSKRFNVQTIPRSIPFLFILLRTLLHSRKCQLFSFQAIPHSLPKTPGVGVPLKLLRRGPKLRGENKKEGKEGIRSSSRGLVSSATTLGARRFYQRARRICNRLFAARHILFGHQQARLVLLLFFGLTGGRRERFFRLLEFGGWHRVIFFLRQNQDWETRSCAPLARVAVTVAAWQILWKTRTIQTSKSEKGFARPAVLQDLS